MNGTWPGDQLTISGAKLSSGDAHGNDSKCPGHTDESVEVDELAAANLKQAPAELVTIQGGADDVNFANCLEYEVVVKFQVSGPVGAKPCVSGGTYSKDSNGLPVLTNGKLSSDFENAVGNIQRGLATVLRTIAPNTKNIAVMNYYQLVPKPQDFHAGSVVSGGDVDLVCRGLGTNLEHAYADANVIQKRLNDAIAAGIKDSNVKVTLLDVSTKYSSHELCTANPAVFGGEPMAPSRFASDVKNLVLSAVCSFCGADAVGAKADIQAYIWRAGHPNSFGQTDLANVAIAALGPLLGP